MCSSDLPPPTDFSRGHFHGCAFAVGEERDATGAVEVEGDWGGVSGGAFAVLPNHFARGLLERGAVVAEVEYHQAAHHERRGGKAPLGNGDFQLLRELALVNKWFLDVCNGYSAVIRDWEFSGDEVEHGDLILGGAIAPSLALDRRE